MAKLGMDDEAVRALAGQLDGHAKAIIGLVGQVEGVVSRMRTTWHGHDADAFTGWWHNQHRPALQRAHDSISGLAQSARNNATAQQNVSSPTVHAGGVVAHGSTAHQAKPLPTPNGTQPYSAQKSIEIARAEVGTTRPALIHGDPMNAPGQCVISVQRWIAEAGGHFGGGGVVESYQHSGAVEVTGQSLRAGDVLQFTSDTNPEVWDGYVHTVLVAGVNGDGTLDIIQSNATDVNGQHYSPGTVTEVANWTPTSIPGWQWRSWRFAATP
jgi:WXG100 family type VII secretion target